MGEKELAMADLLDELRALNLQLQESLKTVAGAHPASLLARQCEWVISAINSFFLGERTFTAEELRNGYKAVVVDAPVEG